MAVARFARNLALFSLGLALTDVGRRAVLPPLPGPIEKASAAQLWDERSTCSVLFVGPSYVGAQIVPEAFNREAERIGLRERACQYGVSGLRGFELRLVLERLLSHDWPVLERVVIDITLGDGIDFDEANWLKPRVVEWHTLESVPWLLAYYEGRGSLPLDEELPLLASHGKHVAAHYLEVGQGTERLGALDFFERFRQTPVLEAAPRSGGAKGRERGEGYEQHVRAMLRERKRRGRRYSDGEWALELRSLVRARGKEAYFLIAPVLYSPALPKPAARRDRLVVLDFNDPTRFPELYAESVRGNTSHLRGRGKTLYSELLARELLERERERERPRRRRR